jgi:hypothetical protein
MPKPPFIVPIFSKILCDQGYNDEAKAFFAALLGRLLRKLSDNWQILTFLHGSSNTGKSRIISLFLHIFGREHVAILPSEKSWPLSGLGNSSVQIWMNDDINPKEFSSLVPSGTFNSLVSGGPISFGVKYSSVLNKDIRIPGLIIGNENLNYSNISGAQERRTLFCPFTNKIDQGKVNTELDSLLKEEAPILVCLFNHCFLSLKKYLTNHNIMDIRPNSFYLYAKQIWSSEDSFINWFNLNFIKDLSCQQSDFISSIFIKDAYMSREKDIHENSSNIYNTKYWGQVLSKLGIHCLR